MPLSTCPQRYCNPCHMREGEREREKGREKMRMGERKREGKRERDGQTKNIQRNTIERTKKMPREKKGNQPDKTQSLEIPKPCTYDFFPTARAAFIGILNRSKTKY